MDGKIVVETFANETAFEAVNMRIDRRTKDVVSSDASTVTTYQNEVQPDPRTAVLVAEYKERVAPVANRVVGPAAQDITRDTTPAEESTLGDLIADAKRAYVGADFAFMNPGGIRDDLYRNEPSLRASMRQGRSSSIPGSSPSIAGRRCPMSRPGQMGRGTSLPPANRYSEPCPERCSETSHTSRRSLSQFVRKALAAPLASMSSGTSSSTCL